LRQSTSTMTTVQPRRIRKNPDLRISFIGKVRVINSYSHVCFTPDAEKMRYRFIPSGPLDCNFPLASSVSCSTILQTCQTDINPPPQVRHVKVELQALT
jgi:hypothetical protein